jgi:hypothetical protein
MIDDLSTQNPESCINRSGIIRMARESGMPYFYGTWEIANLDSLERFAALVAAHEREACIAIARSKRHSPMFKLSSIPPQNGTAVDIANLIRARGEK